MQPFLHAQMLNGPFEDPALFVEILWERRAFIFDLGELEDIRPSKLLKVSHAFVSHTHIDHFIGFDALLRLMLNREKALTLYGPPGFLANVQGKLCGYTWNLTSQYPFAVVAAEVHPDKTISRTFRCRDRFAPSEEREENFSGLLLEEPQIRIRAVHLDHLISSLAFALEERFHINVHKERLAEMGIAPGPWLQTLKQAVWRGEGDDFLLQVPCAKERGMILKNFPLAAFRDVIRISSGQKIAYVADCRFSAENARRITALAQEADCFFCEAAFLEKDRPRAEERAHLTARQAGELARRARVKRLRVFHFSPKYEKESQTLYEEASAAFQGS